MASSSADDSKSNNNNGDISNKLVVITGASSGIGAACVIPFAEAGYPVLMLARNVENMEKNKTMVVEKVGKKCSDKIWIFKCDVTATEVSKDGKTHSISSAVKECIGSTKMYVDCLINNAGVMLIESMMTQSDKNIGTMLSVNINGVLNGIRAVCNGMKERKAGTIINVSSMAGKKVMSSAGVYCGTKFAVQAITEGLRQELAPSNVKVCVICPGAVATNLMSTNPEEVQKGMGHWLKSMDLGILMAEDVSNACYFMYNQHPRCCIRELQIAPVNQVNP